MEDAVNPAAGAANGKVPPASVYGGGPSQGITLPAYSHQDQVKQTSGAVADMVKQVTRQSDNVRATASAAVMGAAKSMQDEGKRGDLKAAAPASPRPFRAAAPTPPIRAVR